MIECRYDNLDMKTEVVALDRDTWREDEIQRKIVRYIFYACELEHSHFVVVTRICYKRTMSLGEDGVLLMDALNT